MGLGFLPSTKPALSLQARLLRLSSMLSATNPPFISCFHRFPLITRVWSQSPDPRGILSISLLMIVSKHNEKGFTSYVHYLLSHENPPTKAIRAGISRPLSGSSWVKFRTIKAEIFPILVKASVAYGQRNWGTVYVFSNSLSICNVLLSQNIDQVSSSLRDKLLALFVTMDANELK